MHLAEGWGLCPDRTNSNHDIQKYKERKREYLLTTEELARIGKVLDEEELPAPTAVSAFRLLLYIGVRLSEIQALHWEHIWGERIHLPDLKTSAIPIPLNGSVLKVLAVASRVEGNPHIVTDTSEGLHLTDLQKPSRRGARWCGCNVNRDV